MSGHGLCSPSFLGTSKGARPRLCPNSSLALDCKGWKSGTVCLPTRTGLRINAPARTFSFDLAKKERGLRRIVCEAQEIVTQGQCWASSSFNQRFKATHPPMSFESMICEAAEITDSTWQQLVLESNIPVLVDFWAPWCGPCRMIAPLIDELARQYAGKMKCFKVNTDESPEIASKYGIRSIPTVMFFLNGQKMDTVIGAVPKTTLTTTIEKLMVLQKREG